MEFLYPNMLYGLFAIAIPILVHLFNFRKYKKVYFSNVEMLQSIHKKTKKQSELKHLLILLFRILTIIAIVLAFSKAYIPNENSSTHQQEQQLVSIYIDNSFSMTHEGENGSLLNEAQNMALEILESYNQSDLFHLITNDMLGRHHRWFNKMEMSENIMDIQAIHLQQSLQDVFQRELMLRHQESKYDKALLYVLSDFQKSASDLHSLPIDSNLIVRFIPLQNNPVNNISIDSLWFENPIQLYNSISVIHALISNSSQEKQQQIPLRLFINGQQKTVISIDLNPKESKTIDLSFTNEKTGVFQGKLEIDDYPIIFDDQFFFVFQVRNNFNISMIYQDKANPYIEHLFKNDSLIKWNAYYWKSVNYQKLATQDLIILNELQEMGSGLQQELSQYLKNGGQILIIPSSQAENKAINGFLKSHKAPLFATMDTNKVRLGSIEKQIPFFHQVFEKHIRKQEQGQKLNLPIFKHYFPIQTSSQKKSQKLLQTRSRKCILSATPYEHGKIYQLAVPLHLRFSNLPEHALLVPLFYQIIFQNSAHTRLYEQIGSGKTININVDNAQNEVVHIKQNETDWIPEIKRKNKNQFVLQNIKWPHDGIFRIVLNNQEINKIAVNYSRSESDFAVYTANDLMQQIANEGYTNIQVLKAKREQLTSRIIQLDEGISLWKYFLILAILFIFVESLLMRIWK